MAEFDPSWTAYTRNKIYCIQSTFKRGMYKSNCQLAVLDKLQK